jgi:hypothetical protein
VTVHLPEDADVVFFRVATHARNRASMHEIETQWSFDDLMIFDAVLTALDDADRRAHLAAQTGR